MAFWFSAFFLANLPTYVPSYLPMFLILVEEIRKIRITENRKKIKPTPFISFTFFDQVWKKKKKCCFFLSIKFLKNLHFQSRKYRYAFMVV